MESQRDLQFLIVVNLNLCLYVMYIYRINRYFREMRNTQMIFGTI